MLAKRYGTLPSDLKELNLRDFHFNLFVAECGIDEETAAAKKMNKRTNRGR